MKKWGNCLASKLTGEFGKSPVQGSPHGSLKFTKIALAFKVRPYHFAK